MWVYVGGGVSRMRNTIHLLASREQWWSLFAQELYGLMFYVVLQIFCDYSNKEKEKKLIWVAVWGAWGG